MLRTASHLVLVACLLLAAVASAGVAAQPTTEPGADGTAITVDHDGDAVTVANDTSQVISGAADFRAGTELLVRLQSTGDTQPMFFKSATAVVTENGTWAVGVDFSRHAAGDTFSVSVKTENGSHETSLDGEVVGCDGNCSERVPDSPTPRPEQSRTGTAAPTARVALSDSVVAVERGDVVALDLVYVGTDTATIRVGDRNATGYELTVRARDANNDSHVTVYVDTALAGREGRTVSASADDSATVRSETTLTSALAAGDYNVEVYAGNGTEGPPDNLGTIAVQSSDGATATSTDRPERSGLGGPLLTVLFGGGFLVGGAVLARALLRD